MFTSAIHDESKKPIDVLRAVPRKTWCREVERFIEEVVNGTISLSGHKFFFLTRKLILSVIMCTSFITFQKKLIDLPFHIQVAGTILTYEIVLMQFDDDENEMICDDEF